MTDGQTTEQVMALACGDEELDGLLENIWALLTRAVHDRRHPWRLPVLSTVGLDGAPAARTVVVRHVDARAASLEIHTDRRSGKVGEIIADPRVSLTFWDPGSSEQIRCAGLAEPLADEDKEEIWKTLPSRVQDQYRLPEVPGTVLPDRLAASAAARPLAVGGFDDFVVLRIAVDRLDHLHLARTGHRRALFIFTPGEEAAYWIAP